MTSGIDGRYNSRLQQLQKDIEVVKNSIVCNENANIPFVNIQYSDFVLSFEHHNKTTKDVYYINVTTDYPDGSVLTIENGVSGDFASENFNEPLPMIISRVAEKLLCKKEIEVDSPDNEVFVSPAVNSLPTSHMEDDNNSNDDDIYDSEPNNENESDDEMLTINAELAVDLERLEEMYDADFVQMNGINECEVFVSLSTEFLDKELAEAWNLRHGEPITMRLTLDFCRYMDGLPPMVTVYQGTRAPCGVLIQLKNILTNFLKKQCITNKIIKEKLRCRSVVDTKQAQSPQTKKSLASKSPLAEVQQDQPGLENGFLVQVAKYAELRLQTLSDYCVICDERHNQLLRAMLKPTVCSTEFCVFRFQTLGVMSDAADSIETQPEVVDLLITMAKAACSSRRRNLIFDPFPTIVNPRNSKEFALSPKTPEYDKVIKIFEKFPKSEELLNSDGVSLKKKLDDRDILIHPLLHWIIANNRSHIIKLEERKQLNFMRTPHQYLMRSSPPAKEVVFYQAKKQFGSTFAFHGSSIENWHSILSIGLLNASGTRYQVNGAAYGKGIYLSPSASVSAGYCADRSYSFKKESKPQPTTCIALCEVINSPDLQKKANNIWVMPNPDFVVTRFFFVYKDDLKIDLHLNLTDTWIKEQINNAYQQPIVLDGK